MRRALTSLLVTALITTACSGSGGIDGPVLTRPFEALGGSGGEDALVGGVLSYDEASGCLLAGQGEFGYPLIWPNGTGWDAARRSVVIGGELAPLGSTVWGGGGYHDADRVASIAGDAVAAAADRCAGPTGEIGVFNSRGVIEIELP